MTTCVSWAGALHPDQAGADAIDTQLHAERVDPNNARPATSRATLDDLPDGAFTLHEGAPCLVMDARLLRWTPSG